MAQLARIERDEMVRSIAIFLVCALLISISLGVLSGWLTGRSGPDHAVSAAIIPAIVSILGGLGFVKSANDGNYRLLAELTVFVAAFCLSFYAALLHGAHENLTVEAKKEALAIQRAQEAYSRHFEHVKDCSQKQFLSNIERASRNLPPLGPEYFCRKVPPRP